MEMAGFDDEEGVCSDDEIIKVVSFDKEVASKYNDGYREGLSAGSTKGFLSDLTMGFNLALPVLTKLFQLKFFVDRFLNHYKHISLGNIETKHLRILEEILKTMIIDVMSNFVKETNKGADAQKDCYPQGDISSDSPLQTLNCKLHEEDPVPLTREVLWNDMSIIYNYINQCRNFKCFKNTRLDEILMTMKKFLEIKD